MPMAMIANLLRTLAIVTYITALALPSYKTLAPSMEMTGLELLIFGWISILGLMTAWLANPIVIFCFFRMEAKPYLCTALGLMAILAAHDFTKVGSLGYDSIHERHLGTVVGLNVGSYFWIVSLLLTFLASLAYLINFKTSKSETIQAATLKTVRLNRIITISCLLIGFLALAVYFRNIQNQKEVDKEIDTELVNIVENELQNLPLQNPGQLIFKQTSANHQCNRSDVTVVYSLNMSTNDICSSFLASLPLNRWQPTKQRQQASYCADHQHPANRDNSPFVSIGLRADNASDEMHLGLEAYPREAWHASLPVHRPVIPDIIQMATQHGTSYYYIHISYHGKKRRKKYPCNEPGRDCLCEYPTYYKSTFSELKEQLKSKRLGSNNLNQGRLD